MTGYVIFEDGIKTQFTIDSSDAPYMFNENLLKETDAYFKIQYPCEIALEAFHFMLGMRNLSVDLSKQGKNISPDYGIRCPCIKIPIQFQRRDTAKVFHSLY